MRRLPLVGVAFDIDGVIQRGHQLLPHARQALARLVDERIPFCLLTNGGGVPETAKAAELSQKLNMHIDESKVIVSHTPFRLEAQEYADVPVLVSGSRQVMDVARHYGLKHPIHTLDLLADTPSSFPFFDAGEDFEALERPIDGPPCQAVFMLHDPKHWGPEMQITLDCIMGVDPLSARWQASHAERPPQCVPADTDPLPPPQKVPVFASNPDLVYAGHHAAPRLAAGAFQECLAHMFRRLTGHDLHIRQVGKPLGRTFDHALAVLGTEAERCGAVKPGNEPAFSRVFMVGDNPHADIRGANLAGDPWRSVLVRTGVFEDPHGAGNDLQDPGRFVVQGIREAVDLAVQEAREPGSTAAVEWER